MKSRIIAMLLAVCCIGAIGASAAQANSEYFYQNNRLGAGSKVSGTPHGTTYFVGAYSSSGDTFCVGLRYNGEVHQEKYVVCTTGSSATTSFGSQYGFGQLSNEGPNAGTFTAEERY
ncbi:MAG: hypothetical protein ACYDHN_15030 [Solirubrobacteraceae bacterium]